MDHSLGSSSMCHVSFTHSVCFSSIVTCNYIGGVELYLQLLAFSYHVDNRLSKNMNMQ